MKSSTMTAKVRNRRFKVKDPTKVQLDVETKTGSRFHFDVIDCSVTGLLAEHNFIGQAPADIVDNDIVPVGKLSFDGTESSLGRLVVKRVDFETNKIVVAFSMIDFRISVDGKLSRHLDFTIGDHKSDLDFELDPKAFNMASFYEQEFTNVDLFDRARKFSVFYKDWFKSDKFAYFKQRIGPSGARVKFTEKRAGQRNDYLMFGSNDYLGLAQHPAVIDAAVTAMKKYGFGSTGVPHTSGYSDLQEALCDMIARLFKKDRALVFTSGYAANVGLLSAMLREQDLVVGDIISHASMHDGVSLSRGTSRYFKHNDMGHLRKILEENRHQYNGCLIMTEGVFSMDGTIGKLDEIAKLAKEFNARIYIDQGHCVGVLGDTGLGAVEHFGLFEETDMVMGLLSKALGCVGGFVACKKEVAEWFSFFSRSYLFATTLPPSNCAAAMKSFELMRDEGLRERLQKNIKFFVNGLRSMGVAIDPTHSTPIIPVVIGDEIKMGEIKKQLWDDGIFVIPVAYPVVSKNRCRFRFSLRADFTESDLDYTLSCFKKALEKANHKLPSSEEFKKAA
jgi:8-amino-7-oxononanoate synthase